MDHCVQNSEAMDCTKGETRCAKFKTELTSGDQKIMVYRKGCRAEGACEKTKDLFGQACSSSGSTCDMNCCQGDLCNAGSFSFVSAILLFACTILAFLNM